ncbi:MAG: cytochrome c4 [Pseudomonadales bacterium]|nr:cytochrome c4 [Pseudomonadales bacterium]
MFKLIVATLLLVSSISVFAEGNPEHGKSISQACAVCHGADGNSPAGSFPSIAGQHPKYLLKQLKDIKSGARAAPLMTGQLEAFSEDDLADLAAYYASQTPKGGAAKPELVALGESIYRSGIKRKSIAACTACHLPQGEGSNLAGFPALAGQWPEYTETQLKAFRVGDRHNDGDGKMMRTTSLDLSDREIAAVASYLYGLH